MRALPLLAALAVTLRVAHAAPVADLVVVCAPKASIAPVEAIARRHGAAVIDRSPGPPPAVETARFLQRGIDAYDALRFGDAQADLDQARDLADRTGAAGLKQNQLSELFLYRGLLRSAQNDTTGAWNELVTATVIDPTLSLDPARFPPKVVEQFDRAKQTTQQDHPQATLAVDAPAGCIVHVDGIAVGGPVSRTTGPHWVRVDCPDHAPSGARIELTVLGAHIPSSPTPYTPPADAELLIQARAIGAHAMIVAEVHGQLATARLVGIDGRELDRRTVNVSGDLAQLADAIDKLLTPPVVATRRWYQSRWAWAAGAAVIAAAVLVPLTAAIANNGGATTWTAKVKVPW